MEESDRWNFVNPVYEPTINLTVKLVSVINGDNETKFQVDDANQLEEIFANEKVKDTEVSILSIVGNARRGKSFLLNFFVRYLTWKEKRDAGKMAPLDWLHNDEPLSGFVWRQGSDRETQGINMYHRPFVIKNSHGQNVSIVLIDTEGTFDKQANSKSDNSIFTISTLFSSMQMYNVLRDIQEIDLQVLQNFTEYSQAVSNNDQQARNLLAELMFVVRDFEHGNEYGNSGGAKYLDRTFQNTNEDNKRVREKIRMAFPNRRCSLLPHPGKPVVNNLPKDTRIEGIDDDFLRYVKELVETTVDIIKDCPKRINNGHLTGPIFTEFLTNLVNSCNSDELPDPREISKIHDELFCCGELRKESELCMEIFEERIENGPEFKDSKEFEIFYDTLKSDAIGNYKRSTVHIKPNPVEDDLANAFFNSCMGKVADSIRRNISGAEEKKNASWINFFKRQDVGLLTGIALGVGGAVVAVPVVVAAAAAAPVAAGAEAGAIAGAGAAIAGAGAIAGVGAAIAEAGVRVGTVLLGMVRVIR